MKRLATLLGRWLGRGEGARPVDAYLEHSDAIETHLNNVAVSLGRLRGNEKHLRFELEAAITKIDVTDRRLATLDPEDEVSREQLTSMQLRNKRTAVELGRRLEAIEEQRGPIENAYEELRTLVGESLDQRDVLMARLDAANARDAVYGDASGVTTEHGASGIELVLENVRRLEAQAEASEELFALESATRTRSPAPTSDDEGRIR
jgi:hypothetical protein